MTEIYYVNVNISPSTLIFENFGGGGAYARVRLPWIRAWKEKKTLFTLWALDCSSFEQTWILFTQWCFVPNLVEIGPAVLEKKHFKFRQCIFTISLLSPLGKGLGPSFEQTWILITPRRHCAKFGWNWPSESGEEDF